MLKYQLKKVYLFFYLEKRNGMLIFIARVSSIKFSACFFSFQSDRSNHKNVKNVKMIQKVLLSILKQVYSDSRANYRLIFVIVLLFFKKKQGMVPLLVFFDISVLILKQRNVGFGGLLQRQKSS